MTHHRMRFRGFNQEPPSEYVFDDTISANTNNYDMRAAAIADGWDGVLPLTANVVINSGVYVGSVSTSTAALDSNSSGSFPAGSLFKLVNNGVIIGRGGDGGTGARANANTGSSYSVGTATAGSQGGIALKIRSITTEIWNSGSIYGGGGGGGGGGAAAYSNATAGNACNGGGGGGGQGVSTGGTKGVATQTASNLYGYGAGSNSTGTDGYDGTLTARGSYGWRRTCGEWTPTTSSFKSTWVIRAAGGNGGLGGVAGNSAGNGSAGLDSAPESFSTSSGGTAGSAGYYIQGYGTVTWNITGIRLGLSSA